MHICTFCFLLWVQNEKKYFLHIIFPFLMQVIKWLTSLSIHIMNRDIVPAMLLLLNHAQFFSFSRHILQSHHMGSSLHLWHQVHRVILTCGELK